MTVVRASRLLGGICLVASLAGCSLSSLRLDPSLDAPAAVAGITPTQRDLFMIPPPPQPIPVAVYGFTDQTGQFRAGENLQSLSRAVTQGTTSILIGALRDAGNGAWFTVVERERLDNLLRERQIIREMRSQYLGEKQTPAEILPSLLFAGITLEGGIISYDSNVQTGGLGARFLGIGGSTQYRLNRVTVYLRAVSVRTGEVLANVITEKSVASAQLSGGTFKFVSFDELLEAEAGVTNNEPMQLAVQGAVEKAVYALIMEGATPGSRQLWQFADEIPGAQWLQRYREDRRKALSASSRLAGPLPTSPVAEPSEAARDSLPTAPPN
jgi:curli production assembly/transport component CsgG